MTKKRKVDRRIRQTRKRLQAALIALLKQKPLAKISIKAIVEEADLSRPTFYLHFETKEALLFSHVDDLLEKITEAVFADVPNIGPAIMRQLLILSFQQWQLHHEELQWVMQVPNKDMLIAALRDHIVALRQEINKTSKGPAIVDEYSDYVIGWISGGIYMVLKTWLESGMRESAETMATLTFELLHNGLSVAHIETAHEALPMLEDIPNV